MKQDLLSKLGIALLLIFMISALQAQSEVSVKPFVRHTMYITGTGDRGTNLDSFLLVMKQKVMDPNPYYVSTKILRHWWGHDSREVILISELKNWGDIMKASERQREILQQLEQKPGGEEFFKIMNSYFSPEQHSDEIYRIIE